MRLTEECVQLMLEIGKRCAEKCAKELFKMMLNAMCERKSVLLCKAKEDDEMKLHRFDK